LWVDDFLTQVCGEKESVLYRDIDSLFKMILAKDLEEAAEKAVGVAEIVKQANKIKVGLTFESL
jgi:hypothetical protein